MAYVSRNYENNPNAPIATRDAQGNWIKPCWISAPDPPPEEHGECVSYARFVTPGLPKAHDWKKGDLVKNSNLEKGTIIATFDKDSKYKGHAAVYESQSKK